MNLVEGERYIRDEIHAKVKAKKISLVGYNNEEGVEIYIEGNNVCSLVKEEDGWLKVYANSSLIPDEEIMKFAKEEAEWVS